MFAERLNRLRKEKHLTAQKMADILHVGIRNYRKYESGDAKPTIEGLALIANILDVPVDYLLGAGLYGKLDVCPEIKPRLARFLDALLGQPLLKKMQLESILDLPDSDFCQLAASLIKDFSIDGEHIELRWRV